MKAKKFLEKIKLTGFLLLSFTVLLNSCKDDETNNTQDGWLRVLPLQLNFSASTSTKKVFLVVDEGVNLEEMTFDVSKNGQEWCSAELRGNELYVTVEPNYYASTRNTIVSIKYEQYNRQVPVSQAASQGDADILIEVETATATSEEVEEEERGIKNTYDGNSDTYFNSKFGEISQWPFNIEYTLESGHILDYIIYHPRSDGGTRWGAFNKFEIWVASEIFDDRGYVEGMTDYVKVGEFERGDNNYSITTLKFNTPIENAKKVRFDIYTSHNNRVSCQEMEFYEINQNKYDYSKVFADDVCSVLNAGVTESDIRKIPDKVIRDMATALLNNAYNTEFRVGSFRPYQDPVIMAGVNKTEKYSRRDNPTGIYVDEGDELLVFVGNTYEQNVTLALQELSESNNTIKFYPVYEGVNNIKFDRKGMLYVEIFTEEDIPLILETEAEKAKVAAKTINIHFIYGKVNGYFDVAKHTQADFERMIEKAPYREFDALGVRSHLTWPVSDFIRFKTDIKASLDNLDHLVYLEQEFMGLEKYGKMFKNRMYFHINYISANPHASAYRTAYTSSYADRFCSPANFKNVTWGPAHEVGHINQTRPGLRWTGTTEITNNIHSLYIQTSFGASCKLMDVKNGKNFYQRATELIIDGQLPHIINNSSEGEQFEMRLVPFWQLKLYLVDAKGQDFYRDLYEHYRTTPNLDTSVTTDGILQLDFVRQVCRLSGFNFIDFFTKWGFLRPVDLTLDDYGTKHFTVTQKQIDDLIDEINAAGYAMPHANVHEINDDNVSNFR